MTLFRSTPDFGIISIHIKVFLYKKLSQKNIITYKLIKSFFVFWSRSLITKLIQKTPNLYLPMIEITSSTCDMVENEVEVRLNLLRHVVTTI